MMNIQEIMSFLPHRYPFLMVDKVVECTPGERLTAIKNVTINEPFFTGHFPQEPVMPGVLIIEALAQACGLLAFRTQGEDVPEDAIFYLVGVDKARFKRRVGPGDQLHLEVQHKRTMRGVWMFDARATGDGALAAEAEIRCTMR